MTAPTPVDTGGPIKCSCLRYADGAGLDA